MPVDSLILILWQYGHLQNAGVTEAELPTLQLHDPRVEAAVKTFQHVMGAEPTGKMEDAIEQKVFEIQRCACPDFSVEAANGSGSWPVGYWPEWPNNHSFRIKINKSGCPSWLAPQLDAIFARVREAYADIGIVFERNDSFDKTNNTTTWQTLGGSTIGLAIVPVNPSGGYTLWSKFDPGYHPAAVFDQWCRLLAHEWGHNMGLNHSRGGIMNPSITSGAFTPTAWRNDVSFPTLKRWFGGDPVNLGTTPTDPNDPTPPSGDKVEGTIVINGRSYILVPKIEV